MNRGAMLGSSRDLGYSDGDEDFFLDAHAGAAKLVHESESDEEEEELPSGWHEVVSRSRPGRRCFENEFTGERVHQRPRFPAPRQGEEPFTLFVVVQGARLTVRCGDGEQTCKWLVSVATQQAKVNLAPRGRLRQREPARGAVRGFTTPNGLRVFPTENGKRLAGSPPLPHDAVLREILRSEETVEVAPGPAVSAQ